MSTLSSYIINIIVHACWAYIELTVILWTLEDEARLDNI
jgi:hypothetical protein